MIVDDAKLKLFFNENFILEEEQRVFFVFFLLLN